MTALEWSQWGISFISSIAIFGLVICVVFPVLSSIWLLYNFNRLYNEDFKSHYGAFYEGMRLTTVFHDAEDNPDKTPDKKSVILY